MRSISTKSILICLVLKTFVGDSSETESIDHRSKRQINGLPLVFPYGGVFKFIIGFGMPIENSDKVALSFAVNFQYQYQQFQNISNLSQYYFIKEVSREEREADLMNRRNERLVFYKALENLLDSEGMNGKDCILRAICEVAQYPVRDEALIGEIMHILLTPDYGYPSYDPSDTVETSEIAPYGDAAAAGRQMFRCTKLYSGCPEGRGVLELITMLKDE